MSMFRDPSIVPESLRGEPLAEDEVHRVEVIDFHTVDLGALATLDTLSPPSVRPDFEAERSLSASLI